MENNYHQKHGRSAAKEEILALAISFKEFRLVTSKMIRGTQQIRTSERVRIQPCAMQFNVVVVWIA